MNFEHITAAVEALHKILPHVIYVKRLRSTLMKEAWTTSNSETVISLLCKILLMKNNTLLVAEHFTSILLELLKHIEQDVEGENCDLNLHEQFCVALSLLVGKYPEASSFCYGYFRRKPPLSAKMESVNDEPPRKRVRKKQLYKNRSDILLASVRFLCFDAQFFRNNWEWDWLIPFFDDTDVDIKWLAYFCAAILTSIPEEKFRKYLASQFSKDIFEELSLRNYDLLKSVYPACVKPATENSKNKPTQQDISHYCSGVVSIGGVLLEKYQVGTGLMQNEAKIVEVSSVKHALKDIAMSVSIGQPVLIEGPVGCGKTAIVEHLVLATNRKEHQDFVQVLLGDQTDSKMLVGNYCCTDIPGEFVWKAGPLMEAMKKGKWLLLEDIDYAPHDVISLLVGVFKNKTLSMPGYAWTVEAKAGFQVFVTRRLIPSLFDVHAEGHGFTELLNKLWKRVTLDVPPVAELSQVIETKWPNLKPITERVVSVYCTMAVCGIKPEHDQQPFALNQRIRFISPRDLYKWCKRLSIYFKLKSLETANAAFLDAYDCFCGFIPSSELRLSVATDIGEKLNLPKEKVNYYCSAYKPVIVAEEKNIVIGRSCIQKKHTDDVTIQNKCHSTFSHTRQASFLLESIAVAVQHNELVLLVGETGTGKTSLVQHISDITGHKLIVLNLSQQSDTVELLGGYKPVDMKHAVSPIRTEFDDLFANTFSLSENVQFCNYVLAYFKKSQWENLFQVMLHVQKEAVKKLKSKDHDELKLLKEWEKFGEKINRFYRHIQSAQSKLVFSFIEGLFVKAMKEGHWILLDEINLAEAETLECLGGFLDGNQKTLNVLENGQDSICKHKEFRLFACMNPATDIGKKDLPPGIRNRFTEFFVEELESESDLCVLVNKYLENLSPSSKLIQSIVAFYLNAKKAVSNLCDGSGYQPHYSLRTLCRALDLASYNQCGSVLRSVYEAFCLSFLTQLDRSSHPKVQKMIEQYLLGSGNEGMVKQPLPAPPHGKFIPIEGYWVKCGPEKMHLPAHYILTDTVKMNLKDLVRIVSARTYPVLLQGETSVGKTSLIQWLAKVSGHCCVRVNNHEHTDLQEYVGSYVVDPCGKLVFKEGVLVNAMRKGHWIILDELNLAPTEVLEAFNRVLDDNRELMVSETQELVKAHPDFMLFATQNPPGSYGGRKMLSRAFRNRFVELHFDEIPASELQVILHHRCALPPSYCQKLVMVMQELQLRRSQSGITHGKQGFMTLRDLFRWGRRYQSIQNPKTKFYDWEQHLADEGYLLLAAKVRRHEEEAVILDVLQKHFKRHINVESLFSGTNCSPTTADLLLPIVNWELPSGLKHFAWTFSMRKMAVFVGRALQFNEPVLLVGNTGCGKTTICQLFAHLRNQQLLTVNCHMHSESSDFLGCLRPVRNETEKEKGKLFEWVDGPLVTALKDGHMFLSDEISLADDSVLERLNSVLELERTLLLAENSDGDSCTIVAAPRFQFLATMNPGGDYGKKELSPALRNRFTEIWCPTTVSVEDLMMIIKRNVICDSEWITPAITEFFEWFKNNKMCIRFSVSLRDVLTWVTFVNQCAEKNHIPLSEAYIHGACIMILDSIVVSESSEAAKLKKESLQFLVAQVQKYTGSLIKVTNFGPALNTGINKGVDVPMAFSDNMCFGIHPFYIQKGAEEPVEVGSSYTLSASTVNSNAVRLLRGMQLNKPILLEGAPGVGKTTLVTALARASRNGIVRINLSEQTDVSDLFGADLPIDGGEAGQFAWRDGPMLQALKAGHWIMLDELNLASQPVLEGLNACLDHRGEIYVPELGRTFYVPRGRTRIFGCQNPVAHGGARKGLPRSFLNRFIQVHMEPLTAEDLEFIARSMYPNIAPDIISKMVLFNKKLNKEFRCSPNGSLWEFNLRDIFRWCELLQKECANDQDCAMNPGEFVHLTYADRMRAVCDKKKVLDIYEESFVEEMALYVPTPTLNVFQSHVQVGHSFLPRGSLTQISSSLRILHHQLAPLQSLMKCIEMNWMAILVGPLASGKTSLVQVLAMLTGHPLSVMTVNSELDTTELLGGFEQMDLSRHLKDLYREAERIAMTQIWSFMLNPTAESHSNAYIQEILAKIHILSQEYQSYELAACEQSNENVYFIATCGALKSLLSKLKETPETSELSADLFKLQKEVESSGNVCNGGKFEWVDSVLVSALKQGHWLLIDDVNFCSPSVLDRLNPLLEPNGTLTISEQGVVNGTIPVIKPHPEFRLILAMDPKNGEISGAMRNRGVEIYLVGEEQGGGPDNWDVQLLLRSVGLLQQDAIDCLLRVHNSVKTEYTGPEVPSLLDLLQAGQLCAQHIRLGDTLQNALLNSCKTAYVRSLRNLAVKEKLESLVEKEIQTWSASYTTPISSFDPPSVMKYQLMSVEAVAHSVVFLPKYLLLWLVDLTEGKSDAKTWRWEVPNDVYKLPTISSLEEWFFAISATLGLMVEQCSYSVWGASFEIVLKFVESLIKNHKGLKDTLEIVHSQVKDMKTFIAVDEFMDHRTSLLDRIVSSVVNCQELPFDPRSNPALFQKLFQKIPLEEREKLMNELVFEANRLMLLVSLSIIWTNERKMKKNASESYTSRKMYSLNQLAVYARKGECSDSVLPHHAVAYLENFFHVMIVAVRSVLQQTGLHFSDGVFNKLKDVIWWTNAFFEVCSERDVSRYDLSRFFLFWHWTFKHAVNGLRDICSKHNLKFSASLEQCSKSINNDVGDVSPFHKLRSKLANKLDCSRPIISSHYAQMKIRVLRQEKRFDWKSLEQNKEDLFSVLEHRGAVHAQSLKILETAVKTADESDLVQSIGIILMENLEKEVEKCLMQKKSNSDYVSKVKAAMQLQLLFVEDHFLRISETNLIANILALLFPESTHSFDAVQNKEEINSVCQNLATSERASLLLSPSYLHVLLRISSFHQCLHLLPSLLLEFFKRERSSLSLHKGLGFFLWHCDPIEDLLTSEEKPFNKILYNVNGKKSLSEICFAVIGGQVLSPKGVLSESIDLMSYREKLQQLEILKAILWKNSLSISTPSLTEKFNSAAAVCISFGRLLTALGSLSGVDISLFSCAEEELSSVWTKLKLPKSHYVVFTQAFATVTGLNQYLGGIKGSVVVDEKEFDWMLGEAWASVGFITAMAFTPWDVVDPVIKQKEKLRLYEKQIKEIDIEIGLRNWILMVRNGLSLDDLPQQELHTNVDSIKRKKTVFKQKCSKLESCAAVRPHESQFRALVSDIQHHQSSLGSAAAFSKVLTKIQSQRRSRRRQSDILKSALPVLEQLDSWLRSQVNFLEKITCEYPLYQDIVLPFASGVAQMIAGVTMLRNSLTLHVGNANVILLGHDSINALLTRLSTFPYISTNCLEPFSMADYLCNDQTLIDVASVFRTAEQPLWKSEACSQILEKAAILELLNHTTLTSQTAIDEKLIRAVDHIFQKAAERFDRLEMEKKRVEEEKNQTFQYKTRQLCEHLSEADQDEEEITTTFPSYRLEFDGLDGEEKDEIAIALNKSEDSTIILDQYEIWQLHLALTKALVLEDMATLNFQLPFLLRYTVAKSVMQCSGPLIDGEIDRNILGSHLVACESFSSNIITEKCQNDLKVMDVYYGSNPSEAIKCFPLLEQLNKAVFNLLNEFPDHSSLKKMVLVVERILSFPITSPLMKFITGLEILLETAQCWEANAHKDISLQSELACITVCIINWRKIELSCWSQSLDAKAQEQYESVAKHWSYLFNMITQLLQKANPDDKEDMTNFIQGLASFFESSKLGEFKARLDLVNTFVKYINCLPFSDMQNKVKTVLNNMHLYYQQFLPSISESIFNQRLSLEKSLKDFVKITRWNDINFWAMKHSVAKSHSTIHRHVKLFEKVLQQMTQSHMRLKEESKNVTPWKLSLNASDFVISSQMIAHQHFSVTRNMRNFSSKCQKFSLEIISSSLFVSITETLNSFVGDVISSVTEFQAIDVTQHKDKEKQKSEAKHLNLRKRTALADLFKTLHLIGLSYQKGLIYFRNSLLLDIMVVPTLIFSFSKSDCPRTEALVSTTESCKKYFYKNVVKFSMLKGLLRSPSEELDINIIHRIQGYAGHLLEITINQKTDLSRNISLLEELRNGVSSLDLMSKENVGNSFVHIPPQKLVLDWMKQLDSLLVQSVSATHQCLMLLNCCPLDPTTSGSAVLISNTSAVTMTKWDSSWTEIHQNLTDILSVLRDRLNLLKALWNKPSKQIITWKSFKFVQESFSSLKLVAEKFESLSSASSSFGENVLMHSLSVTCHNIKKQHDEFMIKTAQAFQFFDLEAEEADSEQSQVCLVESTVDKIVLQIMLSMQKMLGKRSEMEDMVALGDKDELLKQHLTVRLDQSLKDVFALLNAATVHHCLRDLICCVKQLWEMETDVHVIGQCTRKVLALVPLLQQYTNLFEYFVISSTVVHRTSCKLLYVMLNLFMELVEKGFCLPPELQEEVKGEGATKFEDIEDGGFGEGEGTKDVSEKIESQDQLEDAAQEGQNSENEPPDKDMKDEEHGIEMSEDFSGRLQDPDVNDDGEEGSDEDDDKEEELDKQMGSVDQENSEKLDEKLWGDDESDNEDEVKSENEFGSGVQQAETELVAKSDNDVVENKEEEKKKDNQESKTENMENDDDVYTGEHEDLYKTENQPQESEELELPQDLQLDREDNADENDEEKGEEMDIDECNKDDVEELDETEEKTDDGSKIDDEELEKDEQEEQKEKPNDAEEAQASFDKNSTDAMQAPSDLNRGSKDKVDCSESQEKGQDGNQSEEQGVGESDANMQDDGYGGESTSLAFASGAEKKENLNPQTFKEHKEEKCLGESDTTERLNTVENNSASLPEGLQPQKSDLYQHLERKDLHFDAETVDVATEEEAQIRPVAEQNEGETAMEEDDVPEPEAKKPTRDDYLQLESASERADVPSLKKKEPQEDSLGVTGENVDGNERVQTLGAARGPESSIHTQHSVWMSLGGRSSEKLFQSPATAMESTRLGKTASAEAEAEWRSIERTVFPLVQELCEQLRLVLEPTKATRMKGDYRTGKRLNMRKVIPYIASQFRKDKIWLRRTKPSKRQYQIVIALDDSASMADNQSRQMAFESLALLGKTLNLLEAGELAIISFGESVNLVHPLGEAFTDAAGARILQELSFNQQRTRVADLLNFSAELLSRSSRSSFKELAQLLIIVSDGRGIFNEGQDRVLQAVRRMRECNIFTVFIVLDNPQNKDSILDLKKPIFSPDGKGLQIKPYMEEFPFPFYLILRDISAMPVVLGDALRQWFELVVSSDR